MASEGRHSEGVRHDRAAERTGDTVGEERTVATRRDEVGPEGRGLGIDRERQRDEYGGFNIGAAFFGWLVAIGITVLLTALLSAAGAAIGLSEFSTSEARQASDEISIGGAILLLLVLLLGYFAGGYVAGRMSRFDGARQGAGVWAIGLLATLLVAALTAIAGSEYNIFGNLQLPRIPIDEGDLATGGIIALLAFLVGTLIAAIVGGKTGERYHQRVDRVGLHREP